MLLALRSNYRSPAASHLLTMFMNSIAKKRLPLYTKLRMNIQNSIPIQSHKHNISNEIKTKAQIQVRSQAARLKM